MKNITMAFAVAMALMSFGCKKKGGGSGEAMAKMTEFKDKMCKCAEHDTKCAQSVSDEMTKWSQEQSKNAKESKLSDEDQKKAATIGEEMGKCMQKAMTPDMGAAAPPAGDPAAAPPAGGEAPPAGGAAPAPAGGAAPAAPAGEAKPEEKK